MLKNKFELKYSVTIVIILTLFFSCVSNVKAIEYDSCYDAYKLENPTFSPVENYASYLTSFKAPLVYNKTYYFGFFNLDTSHLYQINIYSTIYDDNDNVLVSESKSYKYFTFSLLDSNNTIPTSGIFSYTLTTELENASYFYLRFYVYSNNNFYQPPEETVVIFSDEEIKTCSSITDPDPPPSFEYDGDQIKLLSNFYSIYLDKLGMLSNYATQNYLFLVFIGIIILFILLELFIYLFFINGRRRM